MKRLIAGLLLIIGGCAETEDYNSDYPGWSGDIAEQNEQFTLAYDPTVIEGPIMEDIEQVWLEVQTCIGVPMDAGLTIEYSPVDEMPIGEYGWNIGGYIKYKKKFIRVNDTDLERQHRVLRHEFVHWILWNLGESDDDLENHRSPFYTQCLSQT